MRHISIVAAAVALVALTPTSVFAQQAGGTDATSTTTQEPEHHDFPWGLLGLIGLAGLIPRKHTVASVDRTTSTRP